MVRRSAEAMQDNIAARIGENATKRAPGVFLVLQDLADQYDVERAEVVKAIVVKLTNGKCANLT